MSASTGDLITLLNGRDPVGVVFYRDDNSREDLLELCELLVRDRVVRRTANVEDAFLKENRDAVLAVVPVNEPEAVLSFDGRREELLDREAPAILFLMQGGSAETILHEQAFALSSFLRGLTYDPEPKVDANDRDARRAAFELVHGLSPEAWLERWRRGDISDTEPNNFTAHDAWALWTP